MFNNDLLRRLTDQRLTAVRAARSFAELQANGQTLDRIGELLKDETRRVKEEK